MKHLLATASFIVLGASTVLAADLPARYKAPMMAPAFSWTGCYIGAHAGAGAMHDSWTGEFGNGGLVGGQIGCNYQAGQLVVGIEGEGAWSGIRSRYTSGIDIFDETDRTKNKADYSIAGRFGVALDRTLVYGKAGWVWGQFEFSETFAGEGLPGVARANKTLNGLLVGVGIEHAVTNNWTVKFEYNYLNYGSTYAAFTTCETGGSCFVDFSSNVGADKHIFKIGANYLFNGR
jgi:outer membrane immunogenic protein